MVGCREKEPTLGTDMPKTVKSGDLTKADLTMMWAPFCAKRKLNPAAYTKELATFLNVRSSMPPLPSSHATCDAAGGARGRCRGWRRAEVTASTRRSGAT